MRSSSIRPADHRLPASRRWLAGLVLLHVAAIVALTVCPRLHHWIHPDADDDDHDCAVVLFLHGGCHATPLAVVRAPAPPSDFRPTFFFHAAAPWVASVFSLSRVLEHAPPCVA